MIGKDIEFDVLGCRIKIRADEVSADGKMSISPEQIVGLVLDEISEMKRKNAKLDDKQLAVLIALKFAKEKMILERTLLENETEIYKKASDALKFIEEVSPTTH